MHFFALLQAPFHSAGSPIHIQEQSLSLSLSNFLWNPGLAYSMPANYRLSYAAPYLSYATPFWSTQHPKWAMLHPKWATMHPKFHNVPAPPIAKSLFLPAKLIIYRENPAKSPSFGKIRKSIHFSYSTIMQLQVALWTYMFLRLGLNNEYWIVSSHPPSPISPSPFFVAKYYDMFLTVLSVYVAVARGMGNAATRNMWIHFKLLSHMHIRDLVYSWDLYVYYSFTYVYKKDWTHIHTKTIAKTKQFRKNGYYIQYMLGWNGWWDRYFIGKSRYREVIW